MWSLHRARQRLTAGRWGDAPVNPIEWIDYLQPQVLLASVTIGTRQVLPWPEILASLEGYTLLRTDRNGWIKIETDGQRMWVWTEK